MIVGPWGQILAEQSDDVAGFVMRKLHFEDVAKARYAIPALRHDRDYSFYETKL